MTRPCLQPLPDGRCALRVSVVPNASRTEVVGLHGDALRVRLAAPAIEGRANDALVAWLAQEIGLQRRDVVLKQGATGRSKRLLMDCDAARVSAWLDARGLPP